MSAVPPVRLLIEDPVVVAQAPADRGSSGHLRPALARHGWGPYQFPRVERLPDSRLHVCYHIDADSVTAYGKPKGHAVSSDGGKTWEPIEHLWIADRTDLDSAGILLPNHNRLVCARQRSREVKDLLLPAPVGTFTTSYGPMEMTLYRQEDMPEEFRGWRFWRLVQGKGKWDEEFPRVELFGGLRWVREGMLTFPTFERVRLSPDGGLWGLAYQLRMRNDQVPDHYAAGLFQSWDFGLTWRMVSEIPYQPEADADPLADKRDGFTEPDVTFMPDGSVICLLRTTDGNGTGPLYRTRSTNRGKTWSPPKVFDDLGVWPVLLTLKSGITLAAYGRPGLYLRATADPSGQKWEERIPVVPPGQIGRDTCSYADLLALDYNAALLVYSDFQYPSVDAADQPCKTILARQIKVVSSHR